MDGIYDITKEYDEFYIMLKLAMHPHIQAT